MSSRLSALAATIMSIAIASPVFADHATAAKWHWAVNGNERTNTLHVERLANQCVADASISPDGPSSQEWVSGLEQCLINSKLFSLVTVTRTAEREARIAVIERWTLIPIPIAQRGSDGTHSMGVMIVESNFLGYGFNLMAGIQETDRGYGGMSMVQYRHLAEGRVSAGFLIATTAEKIYCGVNDPIFRAHEDSMIIAPSVGYRFSRTHSVSLMSGLRLRQYEPLGRDTTEGRVNDAGARLTWIWDNTNYRFYYQDGVSVRSELATQAWRSDNASRAAYGSVSGTWQFSPWLDHALQIQTTGSRTNGGNAADVARMGGGRGLRGITRMRVWPKESLVSAFDYQIPVYSGERGTWTVSTFADRSVFTQAVPDAIREYHAAVGVGAYLFMKRVAFPGVGLVWGLNETQHAFVSVSLGGAL